MACRSDTHVLVVLDLDPDHAVTAAGELDEPSNVECRPIAEIPVVESTRRPFELDPPHATDHVRPETTTDIGCVCEVCGEAGEDVEAQRLAGQEVVEDPRLTEQLVSISAGVEYLPTDRLSCRGRDEVAERLACPRHRQARTQRLVTMKPDRILVRLSPHRLGQPRVLLIGRLAANEHEVPAEDVRGDRLHAATFAYESHGW